MNKQTDWIQTYTGKKFNSFYPKIKDINIIDIAHSLSMICRYNGHVSQFYSVAEHSVLVSNCLQSHLKMWGLLHDAAEAYFADIPQPIKKYMPEIKVFENNLMSYIVKKFKLDPKEEPEEVKEIDSRILMDEKKQAININIDWNLDLKPLEIELKFLPPNEAEELFLETFYNIRKGEKYYDSICRSC